MKKYLWFLIVIPATLFLTDNSILILTREKFIVHASLYDSCMEKEASDTCAKEAYNALWWIEKYTQYEDLRTMTPHVSIFSDFNDEQRKWSI